MVSRETQHHTTLKFYKLDIKKPQLCGFCHIILFTSVKNPDNRALFESLAKLGADKTYQRKVLKKQLAKIFKYPAAAGCGLGFLFSVVMDYFNDGKIVRTEIQALGMLVVTIAAVLAVLYAVYRYAQKRAEKIAGIL